MVGKEESTEKEDARDVGKIHFMLLKMSGLVTLEGASNLNFIYTIIHHIFIHCGLLIGSSMYLCGTISKLTRRKGDLDVQVLAETIGICGVHIRYLLTFIRREKIGFLLAKSRNLWDQLTANEEQFIRKFVAKSIKLAQFYVIINVAMCIFYLITSQVPLFSTSSANFSRSLPYMFYTDLEENSPYFSVCVIIQMVSMIIICISSWGIDSTTPFFIMLACGHFRVLCIRLNLLQHSTTEVAEADIVKCILYHQNIIIFCKEIEQLLSPIFLVQLCSSTYNIALVGLKLLDDDPDKFKYITVLMIMLFQLFICQWAPDLLVSESDALFKSAYFIPRLNEDHNTKTTKLIHILIMRAQRSIQLKAGGYVNLSMETFGSIVKGIVSFFTVLRSFN